VIPYNDPALDVEEIKLLALRAVFLIGTIPLAEDSPRYTNCPYPSR
jgi:hypothetical protein